MTKESKTQNQVVGLVFASGDKNPDEKVKVLEGLKINTPFSDEIFLHEDNIPSVKWTLGMQKNQETQLSLNRAINWTVSFSLQNKGIEIPENAQERAKLNNEVVYTENRKGCYTFTYKGQELLELEQVNGDIKADVR